MEFSGQTSWSGLPLPPPVGHVLSELSTITCLSWVALHGMAHSFIELRDIAGSNSLRYADDTTLTAESEEELKSLLMKVKAESEKAGLKLNIQKMKVMSSSPITS